MLTSIFTTILTFFSLISFGQIDDFKDILTKPVIGKTIIKKSGDTESQRTYLGTITDKNGSVVFYVVKEFYKVQAAIVKHGNSRILFFDKSKNILKSYYLGLPEDLPYQLKNNSLFFKYNDIKTKSEKVHVEQIDQQLPEFICVKPNDCYN